MSAIRLTYVLPVHNETGVLAANTTRVLERLKEFTGSRVFLVENGSTDRSAELVKDLEARFHDQGVRAFIEPQAGIGYAYHRGIQEAIRTSAQKDHWIVLSASDLPFEFSDLTEFLAESRENPDAVIFIGSKAHPKSLVRNSPKRRLASLAYRVLRLAVLGMKVRDPQGTFFIRAEVAGSIAAKINSRGFFYTTELVYHAERAARVIRELPIRYIEEDGRKSSVKILKHGRQMFFQMLELRSSK